MRACSWRRRKLDGPRSLSGPRPKRPHFIAAFKHEIPNYMLRHKMKAGMTGYAQLRAWRGNTSLHKRIQHDMHYIRNWSLGLDIRILLQTLASAWFSRHEAGQAAAGPDGAHAATLDVHPPKTPIAEVSEKPAS